MKNKTRSKPWTKMNADELAAATAQFDKEFVERDFGPLSLKGRLLWERARRSRKEFRAMLVVDVGPELAERARAYAKRNGVSIDDVVSNGIRGVLAFSSVK